MIRHSIQLSIWPVLSITPTKRSARTQRCIPPPPQTLKPKTPKQTQNCEKEKKKPKQKLKPIENQKTQQQSRPSAASCTNLPLLPAQLLCTPDTRFKKKKLETSDQTKLVIRPASNWGSGCTQIPGKEIALLVPPNCNKPDDEHQQQQYYHLGRRLQEKNQSTKFQKESLKKGT